MLNYVGLMDDLLSWVGKSGILNMKCGILNIGGGFGGAFSTFKKFLNVEDIYLASMG